MPAQVTVGVDPAAGVDPTNGWLRIQTTTLMASALSLTAAAGTLPETGEGDGDAVSEVETSTDTADDYVPLGNALLEDLTHGRPTGEPVGAP